MSAKTIIIQAKMSGTGSIHDIASDLCDRGITFDRGNHYAVVLAAYYGRGVAGAESYHRTLAAAVKSFPSEYAGVIIDDDGNWYSPDGEQYTY